MVKLFITKQGSEIPPKSKDSAHVKLEFSDYFIAKIKCINKDVKLSLVSYDFKKDKWTCVRSGHEEVLEYYVLDNGFEQWLKADEKIDLEILHSIYNAFDEEDKY